MSDANDARRRSASESSDDVPQLSAHALAALQEFYAEQEQRIAAEQDGSRAMPDENWQLSQFWYSQSTASRLAEEVLLAAGPESRVVCLSCPTLYRQLQKVKPNSCQTTLLEFDRRFKVDENFVFYDYNNPLDLPSHLEKHSFDIVVADPPFLSEECLTKTSETVRFLAKEKVLLCTGLIMADLAKSLLGVEVSNFIPEHENNLSNAFRCYVNYPSKLNS